MVRYAAASEEHPIHMAARLLFSAPAFPARALLVLAVTLLAGCAAAPEPLAAPEGAPGPRIAFAPLTRDYVPTHALPERAVGERVEAYERFQCAACGEPAPPEGGALAPCPECGGLRYRPAFAAPFRPAVDDPLPAVEALLEQRGTFAGVSHLEAPAGAGELAHERREALLTAARAADAAWLVELALEDVRVELAERNALHPLKIVVFILSAVLIFPGVDPLDWFLPGEDYALKARVRWRLWDTASGSLLAEGTQESEARRSFAPFGLGDAGSRSWFLAGFLRVPGCLDEEDWDEIADQLVDRGRDALERALVELIERQRS